MASSIANYRHRLQDKVLIVTGAARHLGQAYAARSAREGAELAVCAEVPVLKVDTDWWDKVFAVNARGMFLATRAVPPYMKEQRSGNILNVGSMAMLRTSNGVATGNPNYAASKGMVMAFTRAICRELGEFNIDVNTLAFGRRDVASDIASTVALLLPEDANFIAGQRIVVNGSKEVS